MERQAEVQEYKPELAPRRGELIAWGCAVLLNGSWILLIAFNQPLSFWLPFLGLPMILIASGISLANWMDRKTTITIKLASIYFSNGLRHVLFNWQEIQEVRVLPAQWGKKVQVFGEHAYFGFQTLGEVEAYGRVLGRTGFVDGERILMQILKRAELGEARQVEVGGPLDAYYYSRE